MDKDSISILDPGCGTAILSCAVIENLVLQSKVKRIKLVTYETDENLIPGLQKVLEYITIWGMRHNIRIDCRSYCEDFILSNYSVLYSDTIYERAVNLQKYDLIISNPPYFKLSKEDKRVKAAQMHYRRTAQYILYIYGHFSLIACGTRSDDLYNPRSSLREDISVCSVISCLSIYR